MLPASKEISAADVDFPGRAFLAHVLVGLASIPAWLPVALSLVAPGPVERGLAAIQALVDLHGRTAVVVLLAAAGLFFAVRGTCGCWADGATTPPAGSPGGSGT
jgi:hypothetical protein